MSIRPVPAPGRSEQDRGGRRAEPAQEETLPDHPRPRQLICPSSEEEISCKSSLLSEQCGLLFFSFGTEPSCPWKQREERITEPALHIKNGPECLSLKSPLCR